jgi:GT2 family glycosyltransferase
MYKVGFVILNYKNYTDTLELLNDLKKQTWYDQVKVYIVDNGSNNESIEILKKVKKTYEFELVESSKNLGFSRGNNLGIEKALEDACDFVICSNSDILMDREDKFIDKIYEIFDLNNDIAIIAPCIKNMDGLNQNPFRIERFSTKEILKLKFFYGLGLYKIYYLVRVYIFYELFNFLAEKRKKNSKKVMNDFNKTSGYIYAPYGSFLIFTPTYFKHFDGFDENTFLYCEEFILAERLKKKKLKCWYDNELHIIHKESKSTNNITRNHKEKVKFILSHMFKSCKYFSSIIRI